MTPSHPFPKSWKVLSGLFFLITASLVAGDLTGDEIIHRVTDLINLESSYARVQMKIGTSSGKIRTFVYDSWSKNRGEKNLIRYLEPRRARGQATLMLNHADDIWMFFPRTQRVRKLATHAKKQKMEGSDFSYEDMGGGDAFLNDFETRRLPDEKLEGRDCFTLELRRRSDSDASYSRLKMWVLQENFVPILIDYYDDKDSERLEKRLEMSDIQEIAGIPTAMTMLMRNLNDATSTEMIFLEVEHNPALEDAMFTERALKK